MTKKMTALLLVLCLALGGWLAFYFSEKQVIRRQLADLGRALSKEEAETPLQMAVKMGRVKDMVAARCQVLVPERDYDQVLEQDLIINYLLYYRRRYTVVRVAFADLDVAVPVKNEARVQAMVHLQRRQANQEMVAEVAPATLVLHKEEKEWLIKRVTMAEALVE